MVNPSDLESAVEILNARSRSLGYGAPFKIAGNNQIIAQVPASADVESLVKAVVHVGLVEFVDFGLTPIPPGTAIVTDFVYASVPQGGGEKWHTFMTNQEFDSVYVSKDATGRDAVSFTLTSDGTKILSEFTGKNVGHYLGIVLDKVVLSSPQINMPITDGKGVIQGAFTQQEAQAFASSLNIGPLPVSLIVKDVSQVDQ
jgi:preprotein translocase subunit SecD